MRWSACISAMLACVARAQTPLLSAACRAAAARTTKPLRDCINLAPPSTGTRSLTQLMELYSPYAHHDHRVTVANVQAADFAAGDADAAAPAHWLHRYRDRNLTTPSCFVVTLRDPAARVHSSINNCRKGENCFKKNLHWCREFAAWNWTADAVASAYFDEADPGHATVNARTCWGLDISTAQKYLGGLDCATAEVHYVCTDRLLEDFAALVARLGENASKLEALERSGADLHRTGNRFRNASRRLAELKYGERIAPWYSSQLSDDVAAWLRADVFPDDAALHAAYCGG